MTTTQPRPQARPTPAWVWARAATDAAYAERTRAAALRFAAQYATTRRSTP